MAVVGRFEVVELCARVRATGYGVRDNERGWICVTFMFAEIGVARAGRAAYEADVAARPLYHDGTARRSWDALSVIARWSWDRPVVDGEGA
jgi:hypothetical protein